MTTEEKAKAYDEAIERAKDMLSYKEVRREDMEYLFLELKKSEDERIRKDIVFYIAANHKDDGEKARWLYWLEKQGEKKPADSKEKLDVLNFIRKETCCGLAEANNALLKLIKVLKERPFPIMDKPRKLKIEWEE